jgi:hypothetical protein
MLSGARTTLLAVLALAAAAAVLAVPATAAQKRPGVRETIFVGNN